MQRIMLRGKIHRATVTQCDLAYEGSCAIDEDLIEAAGMTVFERIELYNVNNGERFATYIIPGKRGSGEISLNGAAARRAHLGDLLIICTYGLMDDEEIKTFKPKVVLVDEKNKITGLKCGTRRCHLLIKRPDSIFIYLTLYKNLIAFNQVFY